MIKILTFPLSSTVLRAITYFYHVKPIVMGLNVFLMRSPS